MKYLKTMNKYFLELVRVINKHFYLILSVLYVVTSIDFYIAKDFEHFYLYQIFSGIIFMYLGTVKLLEKRNNVEVL